MKLLTLFSCVMLSSLFLSSYLCSWNNTSTTTLYHLEFVYVPHKYGCKTISKTSFVRMGFLMRGGPNIRRCLRTGVWRTVSKEASAFIWRKITQCNRYASLTFTNLAKMTSVCFWTCPARCPKHEVQQEYCSTCQVLGQRNCGRRYSFWHLDWADPSGGIIRTGLG